MTLIPRIQRLRMIWDGRHRQLPHKGCKTVGVFVSWDITPDYKVAVVRAYHNCYLAVPLRISTLVRGDRIVIDADGYAVKDK